MHDHMGPDILAVETVSWLVLSHIELVDPKLMTRHLQTADPPSFTQAFRPGPRGCHCTISFILPLLQIICCSKEHSVIDFSEW